LSTTEQTVSRRVLPWLLVVLVAGAVTLISGFRLKDRCTDHNWDGFQYRTSCYNDVYALYSFRGLAEQPVPYVHGDGILDNEKDPNGHQIEIGDLEYPVLTGYFIAVVAEIAHNGGQFFHETVALLAILGLVAIAATFPLVRDRRRLFFFALAPSLLLYAFHNWDLLAVALMSLGLLAFWKGADVWAGVALGAGAAAKVFPGLIVPALMLARARERPRRSLALLLSSAAAFVALNLPILLINPTGWAFPWRFQSTRFPNFETSWYMVYRHLASHLGTFWSQHYASLTGWLAGGLFVLGAGLLLFAESRREEVRPYRTALGILLIWLLTAKVYSPQYALWVLPFFALVEIPWYGFAAFAITDAAVWVAVSAFFLAAPPLNAGDPAIRLWLLEAAVYARYAVLIWLIWLTRRARDNVISPDEALAPMAPASAPAASVEFTT
jgi:uncharacterized membrane protein